MSRYASKRELVEVIRETIRTDHNQLGLPTDVRAYNLTGILRDLDVMGDRQSGWTTRKQGREAFENALRANLRTHPIHPECLRFGHIQDGRCCGH